MHALNIGDSGFRLIRNGSIAHKSEGIFTINLYAIQDTNNLLFYINKTIVSDKEVFNRFYFYYNLYLKNLSNNGRQQSKTTLC